VDPIIEIPTSSLLRRTTKPNPRIAQPDLASDRIVLSDDLRLYIRHAWHVVEPSTPYLENWHIDLIAEYLEAVTAGQIKRLLINMPPRYAKSTCVSIMWPTWVWTRESGNPTLEGLGTKWVFASYADELRTKHSLDRRKMLQSDWYRQRWPKPAELTGDQNVKTLFTNSSSGQMFATTITGAGTVEIRRQKAVMGKWKYAAQYQQDPIPEGGAIFQREWFSHRFHRDPDTGIPLGAKLRMVIQSWDTAAKKKESNDYWACTTWGLVAGEDSRIRMLDRTMDRMEYVEGRQKVKDQYAKWHPTAVLVEDSSSGTAIVSDLRTTGIPLLPISPAGSDKEANARAVSPMFEAGMILLPEGAQWIPRN
jgi:predicted phage terminase large subunit-like protein